MICFAEPNKRSKARHEGLLMLDLLSRFACKQATDQIIETNRGFLETRKARQQAFKASAERIRQPR